MDEIIKSVVPTVGSGVVLAVLGWLYLRFTEHGKSIWSKVGIIKVKYPNGAVEIVGEAKSFRWFAAVALVAFIVALIGPAVVFYRSPGPNIPVGVVVASVSDCKSLGDGWSNYDPAGGRLIIGAGNHPPHAGVTKAYEAFTKEDAAPNTGFEKSTGGAEAVTLSQNQLPHLILTPPLDLRAVAFNGIPPSPAGQPQYVTAGIVNNDPHPGKFDFNVSLNNGEQLPISTMPPFIALMYCVKK